MLEQLRKVLILGSLFVDPLFKEWRRDYLTDRADSTTDVCSVTEQLDNRIAVEERHRLGSHHRGLRRSPEFRETD